ncbi:MAG: O-antigen ligase family protein [Phycisphaerales bacterium]
MSEDAGVGGESRLSPVGWAGFLVILVAALARASVAFDPLPYWGSDPLVTLVPKTGFGPTAVVAIDLVIVVGAMLCALGGRVGRTGLFECLALGFGALGVAAHGLFLVRDPGASGQWVQHGSLDHLLPGMTWAAGLAAMVGLRRACDDSRARRLALGALLGFIGMLAAKGALQVFIEHPMTVHDYELRREEMLAARGWTPGSAMAQAYERRLYQAEATGWFGLSNVLATFAAASAVGLGALALAGLRKRLNAIGLCCGIGCVLALGTLWLTHSKGGVGAAVVGLAWLAVVAWIPRARRWAGPLALAMVIGVVGLVAARGTLGDQLHELSLRFRAQYQVGAIGAWLEHPLVGVGPGGFREAFLRHRPPLSVEEVVSPHSVGLEWVATLGVFGAAWVGLLLWVTLGLGRGDDEEREAPPMHEDQARRDVGVMVLVALAVTAGSAWAEREMATGEGAAMRVVGLVAWVVIAGAVAAACRGGLSRLGSFGIRAVGLVLVVHAMIEVTPVWEASAPLFGALLGAASTRERHAYTTDGRAARLLAATALTPIALLGLVGVWKAGVWEGRLQWAADAVRPAAQIRERLTQIGQGSPSPGDSFGRVVADVAAKLGEPVAQDGTAFDAQLNRLVERSGEAAVAPLERGLAERPDDIGTRKALGRLHLALGSLGEARGDDASRKQAHLATRVADEGVEVRPGSAAAWSWRALTYESLGRWAGEGDADEARESWERVHELDPLGLDAPLHLMRLAEARGDLQTAHTWAREVLRLNEFKRLDPLKQLTETERAEVERVAREP